MLKLFMKQILYLEFILQLPHRLEICLSNFRYAILPKYNKQLLDEVEHDIMNYQNRGLCYLPKPKAEADNTDTRF